jgi:predicted unusual protein kinase regulating ubiquinone biosynthesis (AarF/ABC1/UbiB family)
MATQLDPDFNFFAEATPFARQLISEETASGWRGLRDQTMQWGRVLLGLPAQLSALLDETARGGPGLRVAPGQEWRREMRRLDAALNRLLWGVAGSALLLSGVILDVNGQNDPACWLYAGAGMTLLRLWLGRKFT